MMAVSKFCEGERKKKSPSFGYTSCYFICFSGNGRELRVVNMLCTILIFFLNIVGVTLLGELNAVKRFIFYF